MKALKEKRINLRSLWRMGVVVLSVMALAFVACNKTGGTDEPGEPTDPGPGITVSKRIPLSFTIAQMPTAAAGAVHEGMPFDLSGLVLYVRYSDYALEQVDYDTVKDKITIEPKIYDARVGLGLNYFTGGGLGGTPELGYPNGYKLSYQENGVTITNNLNLPNGVMRLVMLNVTGHMNKQTYLIDEIPDLEGLIIWGQWSSLISNVSHPPLISDTSPGGDPSFGVTQFPIPVPDGTASWFPIGWDTQNNYYRDPISMELSDYQWAWVWNKAPGQGSFNPNDRPGLLLSIGSFGEIFSKIEGRVPSYVPSWTGDDILRGERVQVTEIVPVRALSWAKEPSFANPIFYDDPRLISAVQTEAAFNARMQYWVDYAFPDARIKVTYANNEEREYSIPELQLMNWAFSYDSYNTGLGGTWANLEVYPAAWGTAGNAIDVTRDTKELGFDKTYPFSFLDHFFDESDTYVGAGYAKDDYQDYLDQVDAVNATIRAYYDTNPAGTTPPPAYSVEDFNNDNVTDNDVKIFGEGGWAQWAQLRADRSRMAFKWRNSEPLYIPVQIFNRPQTLTVRVKPGINTANGAIRMYGRDLVYNPSDGMTEFFNQVIVSVAYVINGNTGITPKTRDDLRLDMALGKCRTTISWADNFGGNAGGGNVAWRTMPNLYSTTVYNFLDYRAETGSFVLGSDMDALLERTNFERFATDDDGLDETSFFVVAVAADPNIDPTDPDELYPEYGVDHWEFDPGVVGSVLTKAASDRFASRGSTQRARVEYIGWAGDPTNTRTINNRDVNVAPIGYRYDWVDTDADFWGLFTDALIAGGVSTPPAGAILLADNVTTVNIPTLTNGWKDVLPPRQ